MNLKTVLLSKTAIVLCAGLLASTVAVDAEARRGHGYDGYRGHHSGYRHHSYRHHGHHGGHKAGYLVGGLVLGSLLTHAYHSSNDYYDRRVVYREPVYVPSHTRVVYESPTVVRSTYPSSTTGRRLFRDRDGNCFERIINSAGDEILSELDAAECAW